MPLSVFFSHLAVNLLLPLNEAIKMGPLIYNCVKKGFWVVFPMYHQEKRKETKQNSPYCLDRRSLSLFEMQTGSSKTLHGPTASSPRLWEVHTVGKEVKGLYNLRLRGKEPPTTSGGVSFCPRTVVWSRGKGVVNGLVH